VYGVVGNTSTAVRATGKKSHPVWKLVSVLLVLAVATASYFYFFHKTDEQKIKAVLATYTQAYKDEDIDKMISCLDPKTQAMFRIVAGLSSKAVGFDVFDMLHLGLGDLSGASPDFQIVVHNIDFPSSNTANVDADFAFGDTDLRVTIPMGRDGTDPLKNFFENTWYIKLM